MAVLKVKNGDEWLSVQAGDSFTIEGDMFAWAQFAGDGELNGSSGVSSVSQAGGSGNYLVNFEAPQPDMNYGTHVTACDEPSRITGSLCAVARYTNNRSDENSVNVYTSYYNSVGQNVNPISVTVFRYSAS